MTGSQQPATISGNYANVPPSLGEASTHIYSDVGDFAPNYQQVNIVDVNSLVPAPVPAHVATATIATTKKSNYRPLPS
jgi:hypothetical protein